MKIPQYKNQLLTKEEYEILIIAYKGGYFDTPRRISLKVLSEQLGKDSDFVYDKIRSINKKLISKFIETMNTSLRG